MWLRGNDSLSVGALLSQRTQNSRKVVLLFYSLIYSVLLFFLRGSWLLVPAGWLFLHFSYLLLFVLYYSEFLTFSWFFIQQTYIPYSSTQTYSILQTGINSVVSNALAKKKKKKKVEMSSSSSATQVLCLARNSREKLLHVSVWARPVQGAVESTCDISVKACNKHFLLEAEPCTSAL